MKRSRAATREQQSQAVERLKNALDVLNRATHGSESVNLHGKGPLAPWYAIGAARASAKYALESLGINLEEETKT